MPTVPDAVWDCEAIAEALIREHLTKKKFLSTLKAYKTEQPPPATPITKRSVLQQLLGLDSTTAATSNCPAGELCSNSKLQRTPGSTLEAWIQHQLQAGNCGSECNDIVKASTGPNIPVPSTSVSNHNSGKAKLCKDTESTGDSLLVRHSPSSSSSSKVRSDGWNHRSNAEQLHEEATQLGSGYIHLSSRQASQQQQQMLGSVPWQQQQPPKPCSTQAGGISGPHNGPGKQQNGETAATRWVPDPASAKRLAPTMLQALNGTAAGHIGRQQQHQELILQELDIEAGDIADTEPSIAPCGSSSTSSRLFQARDTETNSNSSSGQLLTTPSRLIGGIAVTTTRSNSSNCGNIAGITTSFSVGLQPLLPEQQRQLNQLLWGNEYAKPDASWQQGILFSDTPGLEWGLVQLAGGPCGVLAATQAHLIGTLMEQGLWGTALSLQQLQDALICTLALIIWTARCSSSSSSSSYSSNDTAYVVSMPMAASSVVAKGLCDAAQAGRMAQVASASSQQEVKALVRAAMPHWLQRKGWGLLLMLYSVLLTRGWSAIQSDMDDPSTALIDAHGYCNMELVNLFLTGVAVTNVFDGTKQFGSSAAATTAAATVAAAQDADTQVLKGVGKQARVGLLTLFEWYSYVEVGQNLKTPKLPVWVVCSESHFTTLALAAVHDTANGNSSFSVSTLLLATAGKIPAASVLITASAVQPRPDAALILEFYDGLARQEGPIQLMLVPALHGQGWTSKMSGVSEDRGTWQGKPIPPVECVIETKWKDVSVSWEGSEPIL